MKKVGYFIFFLSFAVIISSCDLIHFDRYPGVSQDSIPVEFRGEYRMVLKRESKGEPDTNTVYIGKNSFTQIEKDNVQIKFLSDSVVLSKVNSNYYLSERENNKWICNAIKPMGKDLEVYLVELKGKNETEKLKLLNKFFKNGKVQMLENKKIFTAPMDEKKLELFVSKKLKNLGIKLKRVE